MQGGNVMLDEVLLEKCSYMKLLDVGEDECPLKLMEQLAAYMFGGRMTLWTWLLQLMPASSYGELQLSSNVASLGAASVTAVSRVDFRLQSLFPLTSQITGIEIPWVPRYSISILCGKRKNYFLGSALFVFTPRICNGRAQLKPSFDFIFDFIRSSPSISSEALIRCPHSLTNSSDG
ncbi:hypothetical protein Dimus_033903 [Dionaea muscipula]